LTQRFLIDAELWRKTRAGARAGRGFRYQDAAAAWLATLAWQGDVVWTRLIPEGVDDIVLDGLDVEIRAQLKSKHDSQDVFSQAEVAKHLAKSVSDLPPNWREDSRLRLALVLERPLQGIQPSGWATALAETGQSLDSLRALLDDALGESSNEIVDAVLARTHLLVEPDPMEKGCAVLASSSLLPAGARLAVQQLREFAGKAADANYLASAEAPYTLDRSDVQQRIDSVQGVIDTTGYLAHTAGLVEMANFSDPIPNNGFYKGVNVAPGHVGAGLVFARPELMVDVLSGLETKRYALIAGPSGAGKSALAWLAAHHTRHVVRWYRVRELQVSDVARLSQLAKRLEANTERPIGFVVDDVGRQETVGWDTLVREIEATPGLLAIGTVREEDVFILSTAARTHIVRPTLDEELAERIWGALHSLGPVRFGYWQEPFELSHGLLLEYTYLLTSGERLQETIREQVRRRLAEGRDDELAILGTISFAAAQGAAVDPDRLRQYVSLEKVRFSRALQRLIDEHTVRARPDGALTGLHEIRSTYLDSAVREILGEPRRAAIVAACKTLVPNAFAGFIVRVLKLWPDEEGAVMDGLSLRLRPEEASCWTPIFHGLGLATADRVAEKWLDISRSKEIEDRLSSFIFMLAVGGVDLSGIDLFAKAGEAAAEFADVDVIDFRRSLIEQLANGFQLPPLNVRGLNELAASLLPMAGVKSPPRLDFHYDKDCSQVPLEELLDLLITLREFGEEYACSLVGMVGGTEALLDRIYYERPWVTRPILGESNSQTCVTGYVRHVNDEVQPDLNAEVVRLCDAMAAAAPSAEILISNVLLSDGTPYRYGDLEFHQKRMPRRALPATARVAWNRAQIRAVHRLVAAPTETERTKALADAILDIGNRLREAGDFYCRMEVPGQKWRLFLQVRSWLTTFIQPPIIEETHLAGPLENGRLDNQDVLHDFVEGLQQLMVDLTNGVSEKPDLIGSRASDLARKADSLQDPKFWRMTSAPPLETLVRIQETLQEIRAVLGGVANNPEQRWRIALRFSKMSRRHSALRRAAQDAHHKANSAIVTRREEFRFAMQAQGLDVEVFSRLAQAGYEFQWPNVEFAILLKVNTLVDWLTTEPAFTAAIASLLDPPKIAYGAVINDRLAPVGMVLINSVLPNDSFVKDWANDLPYAPLEDKALDIYTDSVQSICAISAIYSTVERDLNIKEQEVLDQFVSRFVKNIEQLGMMLEEAQDDDDVLAIAIDSLVRLFDRFKTDAEQENGGALADALVADTIAGSLNDIAIEILSVRLNLMERAAFST
jgi:hypothetical protein